MKKTCRNIIFTLSAALLIGLSVSPAAAKTRKKPAAAAEAENSAGSEVSLPENKKQKKEKASKKTTEEKTAEKAKKEKPAKTEKVKIVDSVADEGVFQAKTIENTAGSIKYLVKGTVGSFQMYALGSNGSQTPLFAGYDEFTSSFMSLLAGKKEYRLTDNIGIVIGARKSENGVQLVYIVPEVARVLAKFERVSHSKDVKSEIIKVTYTVYNKGKSTQTFALKSVLDTVLGEQFGPHFSTAEELAVNNERQFRKYDRIKWVTSKNTRAAVQFLLNGADITAPEVVSLSNKDCLALRDWIPAITVSRTFDSVLSYQNSALCMNWPSVKLEPEKSTSFVYYMAVAVDGEAPDGEKFIQEVTEDKKLLESNRYSVKAFEDGIQLASEYYAEARYSDAYAVVLDLWKNPENRNNRLASLRKMIEEKLGIETDKEVLDTIDGKLLPAASEKTNPDEAIPVIKPVEITADKLDVKYVQELVDKINAMEDDADVDRNEILQLNAELDAILEKLREN